MPDDPLLSDHLARLAPEVDRERSRDLFERSRTARGHGRRALAAAAAVLLVVGAVAIWTVAGRDDSEMAAPLPEVELDRRGPSWQRSAPTPDAELGFTLVEDASTLADVAGRTFTGDADVPLVDFRRWVVIVAAVPLDSCERLAFSSYSVDEGMWALAFGPPVLAGPPPGLPLENGAPDPGANEPECTPDADEETWTILTAVERDDLEATALDGSVRFTADGVDDLVVAVELDGSGGPVLAGAAATSAPAGAVRFAQSADELPAAVAGTPFSAVSAAVDFDESVVVVFQVPETGCLPDRLDGFAVADDDGTAVWTPRLTAVERPIVCTVAGPTTSYAIAIDRAELPQLVAFRLPDDAAGAGELVVVVAADDPSPPSDDVNFAGPEPIAGWEDVRVSADGLTLRMVFAGRPEFTAGDPCTAHYVPVAEEIGSTVRVLVYAETPTVSADELESDEFVPYDCGMPGAARSLDVVLSGPLGDRTVEGWSGVIEIDDTIVTPVAVTSIELACTTGGPIVRLRVQNPDAATVEFRLADTDGSVALGSGSASGPGSFGVGLGLPRLPGDGAVVEAWRGGEVVDVVDVPVEGEPGWTDLSSCERELAPDELDELATLADRPVSGDGWRVIDVVEGVVADEFVRWAIDEPALDELVGELGTDVAASVDLADGYLAAFTVTWEACRPDVRMDWDGGSTWTAIFSGTGEACESSENSFTALVELDRAVGADAVRLRSIAEGSDEDVGSVEIDTRTGELLFGGLDLAGPVAATCDGTGSPVLELPVRSIVERAIAGSLVAEGAPLGGIGPVDVGPDMVQIVVAWPTATAADPEPGTHQVRLVADAPPAELVVPLDLDALASAFPESCRPG